LRSVRDELPAAAGGQPQSFKLCDDTLDRTAGDDILRAAASARAPWYPRIASWRASPATCSSRARAAPRRAPGGDRDPRQVSRGPCHDEVRVTVSIGLVMDERVTTTS
jgi:hypothetical protein